MFQKKLNRKNRRWIPDLGGWPCTHEGAGSRGLKISHLLGLSMLLEISFLFFLNGKQRGAEGQGSLLLRVRISLVISCSPVPLLLLPYPLGKGPGDKPFVKSTLVSRTLFTLNIFREFLFLGGRFSFQMFALNGVEGSNRVTGQTYLFTVEGFTPRNHFSRKMHINGFLIIR